MAATESDLAAKLLERLLVDQTFRAQFRRDPAAACREAGLDSLAQEMSVGAGKAMMTLDIRESKSSLAGVMMAAAMEGVGIYQFTENVLPHLEAIPGQLADVLSRVDLPAVPSFLHKPVPGVGDSLPTAVDAGSSGDALGGAADAAGGGGGGGGAAAAAAVPAAAPPVAAAPAAALPDAPAAGGGKADAAAAASEPAGGTKDAAAGAADKPAGSDAGQEAAKAIAKENSPATAEQNTQDQAAGALDDRQTGVPESSALPTGDTTLPGDAPPAAAAAAPAAAVPAPAAPVPDPAAAPAVPPVAPAAVAPDAPVAPPEAAPVPDPAAGVAVPPPEAAGGDPVVIAPPEAAGGDAGAAEAAVAGAGKGKAKSAASRLADVLAGRRSRAAAKLDAGGGAGGSGAAGTGAAAGDTTLPTDAPAGSAAAGDTTLPGGAPGGRAAPGDTTLPGGAPAGRAAPGDTTLPGGAPAGRAAAGDTTLPGSAPAASDTTLPGDAPAGTATPPGDTTLPTGAPTTPAGDTTLPTNQPAGGGAADTTLPSSPADITLPEFGPPSPEALALLKNKNVDIDAAGIKDIKAGRVDPRIVAVLTKLSGEHQLKVHQFSDGIGISAIDGESVSSVSPVAREVASELSSLNRDYRPDEIGSPFAIAGKGYFTDAGHQDHIHVGFKDELPDGWKPPKDVAVVEAPEPAPAVAPVAPTTPVVAPAPVVAAAAPVIPAPVAHTADPVLPDPGAKRSSQGFMQAVTAQQAESDAKRIRRSESIGFMKAVEPKAPQPVAQAAAYADPAAAAAAVAAAAPDAYPGDSASQEQIAAWMAGQAQKRGLPPELPLMASLVESGMKNIHYGDADSVGFFQMRVGIWNQGDYAGFPDDPKLQVKWFLDNAEAVKKQRLAAGKSVTDPNQYGDWIADVERPAEQYRGRYQTKLDQAMGLLKSAPAQQPAAAPLQAAGAVVDAATAGVGGGGGSSLGSAALAIAQSQTGVKEIGGANMGPQVEQYLAAAKVAPGNPWCASFVTWSLEHAGHKMDGGGWAAVQTWVRNAEAGQNNLKIVSAEDARPGDIVAYDWGGQEDFGSDGHIGFLDSKVDGGKFTALEGNNNDAVSVVPRQMGSANIKFIRIEGNAQPGAAAPVPVPQGNGAVAQAVDQAPAGGARPAAAPLDPTQFGGSGHGGPPGAEALALLQNKNIVLDPDGIADIKAGRIDPRVVAVLTKLSGEHKITVTCMCSDHDKFTAGGSVSNHHFGRGMDIGAIDGETVGPGSPLAREVASELSSLDSDYRPNEIGSPFAIAGPGYFTDAAHQNHIHVGFKQEIPADWQPPSDVAAAPAAVAPAVAGAPVASAAAVATPGAPVAAAAAAPVIPGAKHASQGFMQAVTAKASSADAKQIARSDSQGFMKAVEAPKATAAAADPTAVAAPGQPAVVPGQPVAAQVAAVDPNAAAAAVASAAPDAYPGDSAPREQIAAWMAGQAQKRGLPPQLPLMASLVESGMTNIQGGDADSVGFFQMRVGIWNQGAYAGYPQDPQLQVKWFLDQAEAVKRQRLVAGKSVTDPNQFGDWIADVERPAEQYRGRYQTKLGEADNLLGSAPAQPAAAPVAAAAVPVDPAAAAASAAALGDAKLPAEILAPIEQAIAAGNAPGPKALAAIEEASKYVGTDYKWGGSTPQTGFDCSGLMQWAYAQSGVQIPRVTYTQIAAANGIEVADRAALKPGDLVFFSSGGDVHHVGMFLGGDKFLHAPHTGDVVKVSSLDEPYYKSQFAGGRRFDNGAGVAAVPAAGAPAVVAAAAVPAVAAPVDPAAAAAVAPAAAAPAAAAAIDPAEVAKAQAAVARDAAEVRRNNSQLFMAVKAVESTKERQKNVSMMFMKAIDPSQVKRPGASAAAAAVPPAAPVADPAAVAPAPAAVPETPAPAAPAAADPTAVAAPSDGVAAASIDVANAATGYPGDTASQAELAKWLAAQADKAGLPPELPVMASLVESGVKNINYGDADSVGFFQMRVGIWNQGAYAGFPEKPELQAKWFIDQALAVKRDAIAKGDANFGTDPAKFGEWIANIERPAEQYRGRYQLRLGEARTLLSG